MVIPARRFNLDMFPGHVETHLLGYLKIVAERCIGRGGKKTIGPVTLVQRPVLKKGLVVKEKLLNAPAILFDREFAHAKVAFYFIDNFSLAKQAHF